MSATQQGGKPITSILRWFLGAAFIGLIAGLMMGLSMSGQFGFALGVSLPVALVFGIAGAAVGGIVKLLRR